MIKIKKHIHDQKKKENQNEAEMVLKIPGGFFYINVIVSKALTYVRTDPAIKKSNKCDLKYTFRIFQHGCPTFYICTTIPSLAYTTKCISELVLVPYELETEQR